MPMQDVDWINDPSRPLWGRLRRGPYNGGRDRDRTCDPYHVKVVLSR